MEALIEITTQSINGAEINSVNARELHAMLEVKTKFADWINRAINKYEFIQDEDYTVLKIENNTKGLQATIEFIISLDMAKELAMVENNQKGKEARRYFIEVEKQSKQPKILTQAEQIQVIAQGYQGLENRIDKIENNSRLTSQQEFALTQEKNTVVYRIAGDDKKLATALHRKVWSVFKKKFSLPRYNELKNGQFQDGLVYLRNITLADLV